MSSAPAGAAGGEALVFGLGQEVFAFPIDRVRQVLRACWPQSIPRPPLGCLGVIEVAGEVVPLLDLAVLLALRRPIPSSELPDRLLDTHLLLTASRDALASPEAEGHLAFWVDRVIEVSDIRSLDDQRSDPRMAAMGKSSSWVIGISAAGQRRALVLDPAAVVTAARRRLLRRATAQYQIAAAALEPVAAILDQPPAAPPVEAGGSGSPGGSG